MRPGGLFEAMLSVEENELLCRVGSGTVMGEFMRQYWIPAMLSSELPTPDSDPLRVLLLGERLIAFRDTDGTVGLLQNNCPHRGASLFFGRNEEAGLRCVYHGWKFDVGGACIDMPNEPAESDFRTKVKATAYPTRERGGVVWAYLCRRSAPPELPEFESNLVSAAQANATQMEANYFQILEGTIDTVHAGFLHRGAMRFEDQPHGTFAEYLLKHRQPRYAVVDTDAGTCYGAYRPGPTGQYYWRIAQFLLPFYAMAPGGLLGGGPSGVACYVPMDDEHTLTFGLRAGTGRQQEMDRRRDDPTTTDAYRGFLERRNSQARSGRQLVPNTTDWHGRFRTVANLDNDFLIDRDLQRRKQGPDGYTGIATVQTQDQAMTNSMGAIYDRSQEHLGTSDAMIIRTRRRLLNAAKAFAETGLTPPTVDHPEFYRLRAGSTLLPVDADWWTATEKLREAFVEHQELDWSLTGGA
jgi:phenylpropionate dioxygenase-like ring-hydroxylating dioxygenase large terminal subunit